MKNENKQEDMINILEHLTRYVPHVTKEDTVVDVSGEEVPVIIHKFHDVLLGGDQLTVERIRGSQRARSNADQSLETLKCFKGVVEDWHSEVAIMKVIVVCTFVLMSNICNIYRPFGRNCTTSLLEWTMVLWCTYVTYYKDDL